MTRSVISTIDQTVEINDVTDVVVTTTEEDDDGYVREIRIMGATNTSDSAVLTLRVRIKSPIKVNLDLTTPELGY